MPSSDATPRSAQFATSPSTVVWSTGELFDGFVWIGIVMPDNTNYVPNLKSCLKYQPLPQFTKVPVIAGCIDQTTQVFYNADLNPPGTTYKAYWYTPESVLIAPAIGTAVAFSVTGTPVTLTVPTLTTPTYTPSVNPEPET